MTQKLSDHFNLPPIEDVSSILDKEEAPEISPKEALAAIHHQISLQQAEMTMSSKVDAALPMVVGLDAMDAEMDDYATRAMTAFNDIIDLAKNVDDRNSAIMFDSASKMLSAAITAKQAKMDKKLKIIELQMRKERLDMDKKKVDHVIDMDLGKDEPEEVEGKVIGNRSELLAEIMKNMKDSDDDN